jgi:hypothetical protein
MLPLKGQSYPQMTLNAKYSAVYLPKYRNRGASYTVAIRYLVSDIKMSISRWIGYSLIILICDLNIKVHFQFPVLL